MVIPFVDLKAQYRTIQKEIDTSIHTVLDGTQFIQGSDVKSFEEEFATYIGASHCVTLNSGTDALVLGIRALSLPPESEIIVPANTFIATALGVTENGLKPVFCDIDPHDYGIDLTDLKKKITSRTKAIIVVHLYGRPDNIKEIQKIIKQSGYNIHLIEDACQAHGATYQGKRVGTFGIFSAFSFYPGKNLGAYGDGGALITNDAKFAQRLTMLREYGQRKKYVHETLGTNSRLDTIQAAVLRVKLSHLDEWNKKRTEIASTYTRFFKENLPQIITPPEDEDRSSVYHLYVIQVPKRDALLHNLYDKGVGALIHYPIPLHLQGAFGYLGYSKGSLPHAEHTAKHILSLPLYPELTKAHVSFIMKTVLAYYQS